MSFACALLVWLPVLANAYKLQPPPQIHTYATGPLSTSSLSQTKRNAQLENSLDDLSLKPTPDSLQTLRSSSYILPLITLPFIFTRPVVAAEPTLNRVRPAVRPYVYSVEWTDPPSLIPRTRQGEEGVLQKFADGDVLLIGEHANSVVDHELEATIIKRIISKKKSKNMLIGLEMVQNTQAYQSALDQYVSSAKGEEPTSQIDADTALYTAVKWEQHSVGSDYDFDMYRPLLHIAREQGIRLVAIGVPIDLQKRVETDGLDGLTDRDREQFLPDPEGFVASVRPDTNKGFKAYTDNVIVQDGYNKANRKLFLAESQALSQAKSQATPGTSPTTAPMPTLENFFSERIFSDEAIASAGAQALVDANRKDGKGGKLLVVLLNADRLKFGYGVQERIKRCVGILRGNDASSRSSDTSSSGKDVNPNPNQTGDQSVKVWSVLLNPTAKDSISSTVQLRLCLAYGPLLNDQRPLADFLWFGPDYPPVRLLTRSKNPISKEGDRPAGESSIIGAFGGRATQ